MPVVRPKLRHGSRREYHSKPDVQTHVNSNSVYEAHYDESNQILNIRSGSGFFSNCSVFLYNIVQFYNSRHFLPRSIQLENRFMEMYRSPHVSSTRDVYFYTNESVVCTWRSPVVFDLWEQFNTPYKNLDFSSLNPLVDRYFSVQSGILDLKRALLSKYNIDPSKCIGVYHRGTDKRMETTLCPIPEFLNKITTLSVSDTQKIVLLTDSQFVIDAAVQKFADKVVLFEENKTSYNNNGIHTESSASQNHEMAKYLLAMVLILAECQILVTTSGNVALFISLFRKHGKSIHQVLNSRWYA